MSKKITLFGLLIFTISIFAQEPTILWDNTLGGIRNDRLRSIYPTADGGCIVGGYSSSPISSDKSESSMGGEDYWVVKLDSSGNTEWDNTIGGSAEEQLRSVKQTSDGGYIISGFSDSDISGDKSENSQGFEDYWVIKLNSLGQIVWENTIGGNAGDEAQDIIELSDGSFVIAGFSNSGMNGDKTENSIGNDDYWILKLSSSGNILWQNTIGGSDVDRLYSIDETNDGGFILGGRSMSGISGDKTQPNQGGFDYWIVKVSSTGAVVWDKTYGGSLVDYCSSVHQTTDGGYILGGQSNSNTSGDKTENSNGGDDFWIIKIDNIGNIEWQNTIGGSGPETEGYTIQTVDGNYLVIGTFDSNMTGDVDENSQGSFDYWIIKLDVNGDIIWQEGYGGNSFDSLYYGNFNSNSSEFFLAGSSLSGISGDKTEANIGNNDYWILKLDDVTLSSNDINLEFDLKIFPNPVLNNLSIISNKNTIDKLSIFSINGALIKTQSNLERNDLKIDVSKYKSGVYFTKIESEGKSIIKKFIKK